LLSCFFDSKYLTYKNNSVWGYNVSDFTDPAHYLNLENIPAQTIAPKFSGRFNKGVEYVGNVAQFAKEFEDDLAVIQFAIKSFGLNENLKLSVHSGSDKFAI